MKIPDHTGGSTTLNIVLQILAAFVLAWLRKKWDAEGKVVYKYKSDGNVRYRKRSGLRYSLTKWKPFAYANHIGLRFNPPQ
jgi:hypothetical protein